MPTISPFEVELEGDPQVEILLELVVVSGEGACCCPAVDWLQDRRLDFQVIMLIHPGTHGTDHP
jgi:hypothetical protein